MFNVKAVVDVVSSKLLFCLFVCFKSCTSQHFYCYLVMAPTLCMSKDGTSLPFQFEITYNFIGTYKGSVSKITKVWLKLGRIKKKRRRKEKKKKNFIESETPAVFLELLSEVGICVQDSYEKYLKWEQPSIADRVWALFFSAAKLNVSEADFKTGIGCYRADVSFHNLVFVSICAHTPIKVHELLDLKLFQNCLFY